MSLLFEGQSKTMIMRRIRPVGALLLGATTLAAVCLTSGDAVDAQKLPADRLDNWHQWRGPAANGTAPKADPPVEWGPEKNIKWKTAIPGEGQSTPIVWNDKIFILSAVKTDKKVERKAAAEAEPERPRRRGRRRRRRSPPPTNLYQYVVTCVDRATGQEKWRKVAIEELPHEGRHRTSSFASLSPTTDGKHLYASFGSRGTYCFDLDGNLVWKRDLGDMRVRNRFGEGTSPVIYGDSLIHLWDHEGDSFIVCLDAKTGKDRWRVERDEPTTWDTPLIVEHGGVTQVIANGTKRTRSYDLATGKLLWECGGQAANPIACPVAKDGVVYCMTGHRGFAVVAIPLDSRGDVTEKVKWKRTDSGPYVASPLLYDDYLYYGKNRQAILSCVSAKTGEPHFNLKRLPDMRDMYASPIGAKDRVYLTGRNGTTVVLKKGPQFEILATNKLDETIDASPVAVGKELFLRGEKHLYCIANSPVAKQ